MAAAPAAALAQSPRMIIPPLPPPDRPLFRVEVTTPGIETALDAVRRELAADPLPGRPAIPRPELPRAARVDVLPAVTGLVRRVQKARRANAERRIHADVTSELAAFCDVNDCAAANEGLLLPRHR